MLASLTFGDFFERVGETFRLEGPSGVLLLTLVEATDLALAPDGRLLVFFDDGSQTGSVRSYRPF